MRRTGTEAAGSATAGFAFAGFASAATFCRLFDLGDRGQTAVNLAEAAVALGIGWVVGGFVWDEKTCSEGRDGLPFRGGEEGDLWLVKDG